MTGEAFRKIRDRMGWTQAQAAKELGVHPFTVSKWEREAQPIPEIAVRLLRCLAGGLTKKRAR